ncbi:hypothetical protein COV58_03410 [Candidatus Roizmanbacteria bacterium CG11_big_fil_rev_8_21_14_0_20_36_8]|uniref:Resuscitation-promoting factor core lysozyme-like domain-containing protein n=2 Tax=Candidatus Roizmaniibacteriota TaxID=1752723 RepID=A0A2M6ITT5_9BACT|nr:MAG: hypothetical protein COV58_03410 [Candidatus Roizmanbacteria bacterium CG11_big_fil_rev_8_21_14_0_20_36_8]PIZ64935.1 MAG: hypothetical protein COY14_03435 [Candidatus Roizmanbacteria bacterium CG_4_10_14_0_2_um_filter_36_9]
MRARVAIFVIGLFILLFTSFQIKTKGELLGVVITPTFTPSPTPTPTNIPTPTNTPTPTSMPISEFENYFDQYAKQYEIDKDQLKKIAYCESGGHPGAANGEYGGMFQFTSETWLSTRSQMGADTNPDLRFGAKESIETAAFRISHGGINAWANCK